MSRADREFRERLVRQTKALLWGALCWSVIIAVIALMILVSINTPLPQ
jgi:hypothetical protein